MAMRVTERFGDIGRDCSRPRRRERRLGADDGGQRLAVHVLHDYVVGAVGFAPVKDRDDVRVRQVRDGLCFPTEPLDEGVVRRQLREEHLEGDGAIQEQVMGEIDLGRPTACDLTAQFVATVVDGGRGLGHRQGSLFVGLVRHPPGARACPWRPFGALVPAFSTSQSER